MPSSNLMTRELLRRLSATSIRRIWADCPLQLNGASEAGALTPKLLTGHLHGTEKNSGATTAIRLATLRAIAEAEEGRVLPTTVDVATLLPEAVAVAEASGVLPEEADASHTMAQAVEGRMTKKEAAAAKFTALAAEIARAALMKAGAGITKSAAMATTTTTTVAAEALVAVVQRTANSTDGVMDPLILLKTADVLLLAAARTPVMNGAPLPSLKHGTAALATTETLPVQLKDSMTSVKQFPTLTSEN